jgi:hypothetical protein
MLGVALGVPFGQVLLLQVYPMLVFMIVVPRW